MSAIMTTNTMPALGMQLASMVRYSSVCASTESPIGDITSSWDSVHDDVVVPFGIEDSAPPKDIYEARERLALIIPRTRNGFDDRIGKLFQRPVTRAVLDEQKIDVDIVRKARDDLLIQQLPANALIQSALTLGAAKAVKAASPSVHLLMANLGMGVLYGAILTYILFAEGLSRPGVSSAIPPILWSLVLIYSISGANRLNKVKDAFAERWHEIFPDKKS
jgi:hypothetical protein